jgi:hypothetical protein
LSRQIFECFIGYDVGVHQLLVPKFEELGEASWENLDGEDFLDAFFEA